ncbi:hypothetical protein PS2_007257 [Malus domestica]
MSRINNEHLAIQAYISKIATKHKTQNSHIFSSAMEHWTRGPTVGRGSTATVSLATSTISGERFAVKSTELSSSSFLQKEQCFLSKLSCPHIVKYLGCNVSIENNEHMYNLCMEYVSGGTLFDAIRRRGGPLEEAMIQLYTHQIVQGLEYLHENKLVHCDIKSQNILVTEESAKIADLGCAKLVQGVAEDEYSVEASATISGTPVFMAPEVARGEEQGFGADIWALGCTIIEMATGGGPWPEINDPVSAIYRIGFSGEVPEIPSRLSSKGKDFLSKCLMKDPRERWTAKQLLEHPFLEEHLGSKFNTEQVMGSPISVLDQGLWDSFEGSESPTGLQSVEVEGVCLNSPTERIKKLIGFSTSSYAPNWEFDESWSTVRSNGDEELENLDVANNNVVSDDEVFAATSSTVASIVLEETESLNSDEDLDFEFMISNSVIEDYFVSYHLEIESDNQNYDFIHSHCYHSCLSFACQICEELAIASELISALMFDFFPFATTTVASFGQAVKRRTFTARVH